LRQSAMLNIRMRGDAGARKSARRNAKAAQPRGFQQCILPAVQVGDQDGMPPVGASRQAQYSCMGCGPVGWMGSPDNRV